MALIEPLRAQFGTAVSPITPNSTPPPQPYHFRWRLSLEPSTPSTMFAFWTI